MIAHHTPSNKITDLHVVLEQLSPSFITNADHVMVLYNCDVAVSCVAVVGEDEMLLLSSCVSSGGSIMTKKQGVVDGRWHQHRRTSWFFVLFEWSVTKWLTWQTDWSATVIAWERKRYFQPVNDWNNPTQQQYILTKPLQSSPFQSFHPSDAIKTISQQGVQPMTENYIPLLRYTARIGCITIFTSQ